MDALFARLRAHAERTPERIALRDERVELDYRSLLAEVERLAISLPGRRVGLLLDNGAPWACLDLALLRRASLCVPMPVFFSDEQLRHLLRDAQLDTVLSDSPERMQALLPDAVTSRIEVAGQSLWLHALPTWPGSAVPLPNGTAKVTYTSGSSGQPKGVCLSAAGIEAVAATLCKAVAAGPADRSLSLLPLSTLLENIAGLYAPLMAGALAQVPSLSRCGVSGSSGLDGERLFMALAEYRPTTLLLVPQLLKTLVAVGGAAMPKSLRFVAVGGAPVAAALLEQARSLGLPVYQGYGLSEAGSVISLELPGASRTGSVGKPLPHHQVSISRDGEVIIHDHLFLGYLGDARPVTPWYHTGDLGHFDADGYLHITGRKKTVYATAYGRNVAPEWPEGELCGHPLIVQAAVFGEAETCNLAVLVSRASDTELDSALRTVNARLPDYARVRRWLRAEAPFSPANGQANSVGCIRRVAIHRHYQTRIEALFAAEDSHAVL